GFRDEMIRDRLIVGIRDQRLSERLQLDATLDLEKAKKMVRQQEAVKDQSQDLTDSKPGLDSMSAKRRNKPS
uniref:Uncharacterized protein n=1 Tax=Amphimedon queenslandica TaxID=400682 RepID=A0A1X7SPN9_AMPQE